MSNEYKGRKVLMIADSDSIWTKRYIENVLLPAGFQVVLFPIYPYQYHFDAFYQQNSVLIYRDRHTLPVIRHIPRLRMWARILLNARSLKHYGTFDAVHCHYISQRDLALGALVSKRDHAVFLAKSLGSDVLRVSSLERKRMGFLLKYAKAIHTSSRQSAELLGRDCGRKIANKISVLNYGVSEYDSIDAVQATKTKSECRQELGIIDNHYVISVGSNASSGQRQLEMVEALTKLPDEVCQDITLVLVQSYGKDSEEYVSKTRTVANQKPWQTMIVTDFMNAEQYAVVQTATDLFILGAITDTFSYSLREYLYSGACALKGSWLNYDELDELDIRVDSFDTLSSLPQAVMIMMKNGKPLSDEKRIAMKNNFSWRAVVPKWLSYYQKEEKEL